MKKYILDLSETKTIQNVLKNETVNWDSRSNQDLLHDLMYDILTGIALPLNMDLGWQDTEKGIIAANKEMGTTMLFDTKVSKYKTPYVEILLDAPEDKIKELHNDFMNILMEDDDFLSEFLNFEHKEGLDTVLPGNAIIK